MQDSLTWSARPVTPPAAVYLEKLGSDDDDDHVGDAAGRPPSTPCGSVPSPLSSLSLSLHHAGIIMSSPLSPMRRHFLKEGQHEDDDDGISHDDGTGDGSHDGLRSYDPSSTSSTSSNDEDDDDLAEDSRDVLVDRLNDLVRHLTTPRANDNSSNSNSSNNNNNNNNNNNDTTQRSLHRSGRRLGYDGHVLTLLHARVDEMESALVAAGQEEHQHPQDQQQHLPTALSHLGILRPAPILVPALSTRPGPASMTPTTPRAPKTPKTPKTPKPPRPAVSRKLAAACDELAGDLSIVLASLRGRSEELEHMQNLLLSQLAAANDRIAALEAEAREAAARAVAAELTAAAKVLAVAATPLPVSLTTEANSATPTATMATMATTATMATVATSVALESPTAPTAPTAPTVQTGGMLSGPTTDEYLEELESEVTFLRLQLRGIEVRYRTYVPANADPELDECIENWKADWVALQARVTQEQTLERTHTQTQA